MSGERADTLILALGNAQRGDDGAGAAVLAALGDLPGVDTIDGGTPGLETVLLMDGYQRVLIIDAAEMGLAPGMWRIIPPAALRSGDLRQMGTVHAAGLAEALALAESLGILPDEVIVIGVQPADMGWEPGLSRMVERAVPAIAAMVREWVVERFAAQLARTKD